jgi:outer membrane protein assembly factor BamB
MSTRLLRAVAALGLVTASGCWLQSGFDAQRSGANGGETTITSATIGDLAVAWSVPVANGPREAVVNGSTVYVRSNGNVQALDVATGAVRWTAGPAGSGAAAFAGDRLWVPASGDACSLKALDPQTGAILSSTPMGGPAVSGTDAASLCLASDALTEDGVISTSWTYAAVALGPHGCFPDLDNLTGDGTHTERADGTGGAIDSGGVTNGCGNPGLPPTPTTLSSDGTVTYELTGTGIVRHFASGVGLPLPAAPGFVPVPTVAAGGRLVLTSTDGRVFVLDATSGAVQWTGTVGASASVPVAVTPTTVFAADGAGTLAAFPLAGCGAATCAPAWTATATGAATGRPSVGGDVVYVGGSDGSITAVPAAGCGAATCDPLWSANVGSAVSGSPVIDRGTLYVGGSTTLTAYRLPA